MKKLLVLTFFSLSSFAGYYPLICTSPDVPDAITIWSDTEANDIYLKLYFEEGKETITYEDHDIESSSVQYTINFTKRNQSNFNWINKGIRYSLVVKETINRPEKDSSGYTNHDYYLFSRPAQNSTAKDYILSESGVLSCTDEIKD